MKKCYCENRICLRMADCKTAVHPKGDERPYSGFFTPDEDGHCDWYEKREDK